MDVNRSRIMPVARWFGAAAGAGRRRRQRRVPVQLQLNAVECGAACLAMILGYHGRRTRVAECRDWIGVGRDGLTARTLAEAARGYGLRVRAYSLEPAELRQVSLPVIAHWNFDHFVVVERWSPARVEIVDPAVGRRSLTAAEFAAGFTGVVLAFEPGDGFERGRSAASPPWRAYLRTFVGQAPGVLAQVLAASLLLQVLGLALPIFTGVLVDRVLPRGLTGALPILGLGLGIVVLAQLVTSYLRAVLLLALRTRADARLMLGFFEHLLSLPYRFFEQRGSGDLLMRLWSNTVLRETLTNQTLSVVLDGTLVLGYLAFLLLRDPLFGAAVLAVGLLQVGVVLAARRRTRELTQRDLLAQAASESYLVETLSGVATLKASGSEDRVLAHWSGLYAEELNVSVRRDHLAAIVDTALTALRSFAPLALLWLGALRVLDGTMSLGTMLALQALAAAALTPLASLVANGQRLQLVGAHLDRLADVLEAEPEQRGAAPAAPPLTGRIEIDGVGFRYDPQAPWVLRDVSLVIEPGQKVALVGRTGSGKSTLGKLLLGLYPPTAGEIRYDGRALATLNYRSLRRQLGVVLQEPFLFSGSIRQNIALNDPELTLEQVRQAARLAGIDDEIMHWPMGYETRLAEGGAGLSGGQRQRLVLARAFAQRPAVLLLDEATSHLDVITEAEVDQNLARQAGTRIVIAHRLSTIRDADLIVVLEAGRIAERGTHETLLARNGAYAALVRQQLATDGAAVGAARHAADPRRVARIGCSPVRESAAASGAPPPGRSPSGRRPRRRRCGSAIARRGRR